MLLAAKGCSVETKGMFEACGRIFPKAHGPAHGKTQEALMMARS